MLATMISRWINGSASFFPTLAGGLVLVVMHRGLTRIAYRSPAVARIVKGTPVELVRDGKWVEPTLSRHALSHDDIEEDFRLSGSASRVDEVKRAIFERNGRVSVAKDAS
jgi:uncharacterized membrane protein YcaP (DUF421 family)